jgi:DNA polymerase V
MDALQLYKGELIEIFSADTQSILALPMVSSSISAGFPSPAMDFIDLSIDLNRHLIKHPSSTYYGKVKGDSMKDAGINEGDLLVIDKSAKVKDNDIAVCFLDGDFILKTIKIEPNGCWLLPANDKYQPIYITEQNDFLIWGIVKHVIKSY